MRHATGKRVQKIRTLCAVAIRQIIGALSAVLILLPAAVAAEETRSAYVPPPPAVSSGSIMQIVFSLLLVLAAIVLVGWLLKRINVAQQGTGNLLKVLGSVPIGQRERIVLVEVKDTWLVVGVGPSQIRTLHTLEKPPANEQGVASSTLPADRPKSFSGALSEALGSFYQGKRRQPPETDTVEATNAMNGRSRNAP